MYKVVTKRFLNDAKTICLFEIEAPLAAKHAQAGQFVIFRLDEQGERVPVSVADRSANAQHQPGIAVSLSCGVRSADIVIR